MSVWLVVLMRCCADKYREKKGDDGCSKKCDAREKYHVVDVLPATLDKYGYGRGSTRNGYLRV